MRIYGRKIKLLTKTFTGMWYTVSGTQWGKVVVTKDPSGRLQSRAYYSTNASLQADKIIELFAKRWEIEVSFRNVKQHLGIEEPQNGWWRRLRGEKAESKVAGPNAKGEVGKNAVERTFPFVFYVYAISILWFIENGDVQAVVAESMIQTPWCKRKTHPSYSDILVTLRRQLWKPRISEDPKKTTGCEKSLDLLPRWMLAA